MLHVGTSDHSAHFLFSDQKDSRPLGQFLFISKSSLHEVSVLTELDSKNVKILISMHHNESMN